MIKDKFAQSVGLVFKPSTIQNAGIGVFASKHIPLGTIVAKYKGTFHFVDDIDFNQFYNKDYTLSVRNGCIDAHPLQQDGRIIGYGGFINDARDDTKNNCQYVIVEREAYVVSIKNFGTDEELFVNYGQGYWRGWEARQKMVNKIDDIVDKVLFDLKQQN